MPLKVTLDPATGIIKHAWWDKGRPAWSMAMVLLYPLQAGQHRRHIIPWNTLHNSLLSYLEGKTVQQVNDDVSRSGLALMPPLLAASLADGIYAPSLRTAMTNILEQINSCPVNVWPGPADANMSKGFKFEPLKAARARGDTHVGLEVSGHTFKKMKAKDRMDIRRKLDRGDVALLSFKGPGGVFTARGTRGPVGAHSQSYRAVGRSRRVWTHVSGAHEFDPPGEELNEATRGPAERVIGELGDIYQALQSIQTGMMARNGNIFHWYARLVHRSAQFMKETGGLGWNPLLS